MKRSKRKGNYKKASRGYLFALYDISELIRIVANLTRPSE